MLILVIGYNHKGSNFAAFVVDVNNLHRLTKQQRDFIQNMTNYISEVFPGSWSESVRLIF